MVNVSFCPHSGLCKVRNIPIFQQVDYPQQFAVPWQIHLAGRKSPLPCNKEGFREEINIRFLSNPILGIQNLELDKDETFERRIKAISVVPA